MSSRHSLVTRLYRALSGLLPPHARRDRAEMVSAFADMLAAEGGRRRRVMTGIRSLVALACVVVVEWLEVVGVIRAPGGLRRGRSGMSLVLDVRYALRTLRRTPAFSITSLLLVAVGVGAVTTIFTLVDHVLLRPLPYPAAERLVALDNGSFQGPYFRALEDLSSVEHWAGAWADEVNLVGEGDPARLQQVRITERFFDVFGARAQLGRLLGHEDYTAANAVVLDAGAWRRYWGGDPSVVGRSIRVDGEAVTVVGVVDGSFVPPEALVAGRADVWRPIDWSSERMHRHTSSILQIAGRLAPGVAIEAAQEEVDALGARMLAVHENYGSRDGTPRDVPVLGLSALTVQRVRTGLGLLMGAVSMLLLIACANVANLFLARGIARSREMAVRRALGGGAARVAGQLLVESLVVGVGGGVLGTGLAWIGIRVFVTLNPTALPRQAAVVVDGNVLGFAILVSIATSVLFGLLPALRSVGGELADELRGAGRTATSSRGIAALRKALVGGEIALSLVLVSGAGLLLRSFMTVRAQDPGFEIEDVWAVPLNLPEAETPEAYRRTMDGVLDRVQDVPGVRSAAYGFTLPMQWTGGSFCCWSARVELPGREDDPALVTMLEPVSVDYLATLGMELIAGRTWTDVEVDGEPVPVVVTESLARALSERSSTAVGTRAMASSLPVVIVGVVADTRHYGLDRDDSRPIYRNQLFLPVERLPFGEEIAALAVRADSGAGDAIPRALREAIWEVAPGLPITGVEPIQAIVDASTAGRRFDSVIFGVFATVALLLAAGGLYGTLAYLAGQRRRELGIRLALGASRGEIEAHILGVGLRVGAVGIAVGLAASWISNRLLESRIWGVERGDPWALGGAALVLLATAVAASWLPARRAGTVDPVETLRAE